MCVAHVTFRTTAAFQEESGESAAQPPRLQGGGRREGEKGGKEGRAFLSKHEAATRAATGKDGQNTDRVRYGHYEGVHFSASR